MIFLHISDIHFLRKYNKAESGYNSIFNNMTNPIEQIRKAVKKIEKEKLDFVIITGDLVEEGTSDDYKVLKENLDTIFKGIPYIVTLGNHDNKEEFYKGWLNEELKDIPYNTTMKIGDIKIISFDNSEFHNNNGIIDSNRCSWLRNELEKDKDKKVILMLHHHLLEEQFNLPQVSFDNEFKEIIKNSSIIAIFSGHTHHPYKSKFMDIPYFTSGSLSFIGYNENNGEVRFEENSKVNLCKYDGEQIIVEVIEVTDERKVLTYVKF